MKQIKDSINAVAANIICPIEISTGFPQLDELTRGLHRKELTIIAGRSSMGKTSLMLDIALHTSQGLNTGIFSLEMSSNQLIERAIANKQKAAYKELKEGKINVEKETIDYLSKLFLYIDDRTGITPLDISKTVEQVGKLDIIFIDYLQLLRSYGRGQRYEEVDKITNSIREIAKAYNVSVVLLAQLNRNIEHRDNHVPKLSDLRESGGIEQSADTIIFIDRPPYWTIYEEHKEITDTGEAYLYIMKQRNGPLGKIPVVWFDNQMSFKSPTWDTKEF